jgi:DNA-damage-inducible protein D
LPSVFEKIKQVNEYGQDFWSARQLAKILKYSEYRHFLPVVKKAKEACMNSGQQIDDHFEDVLEMVRIGSGAMRQVEDIKLVFLTVPIFFGADFLYNEG